MLTGIFATGLFLMLLAGTVILRQNLLLTVSATFVVILALRIGQAVAVGGVMPAAQAYIADSTAVAERARGMGRMGAAFAIGTIAGGGIAMALGHLAIVYGLVALGLGLLTVWAWGHRRLAESRTPAEASRLPSILPYGRLWPMLLITFSALLIYGALQQVLGLRLQDQFGFSLDNALRGTGGAMMASMAAMAVTQGLIIRFLRWSPERLLASGCLALFGALALAAYATTYPTLFASMVLLGFGMGLMFPGNLALISLSVDGHAQGKAAGVNSLLKGLGMGLGPLLGAFLHSQSVMTPFYTFMYLAGLMLIVGGWIARKAFTEDSHKEPQST